MGGYRWVALESLADGGEHVVHQDFTSNEVEQAQTKFDTVEAGLVVGLIPNTKLVVLDGCFAQSDLRERRVLEFGPGHCALF